MKTVEKKVYYCDFCKRYKLTPQSMRLHEGSCTLNPNRKCRIRWCNAPPDKELITQTTKYILSHLEKNADIDGNYKYADIPKEHIEEIVDKTECAVCTLAIIRLTKKEALAQGLSSVTWDWSFKDEAKRLFDAQSEMEREERDYAYL